MALRQHNSKHFDRTFGAAVLPVWTASAVEQMASWIYSPGYLLHTSMGTGTGTTSGNIAAAANLPQSAVEAIAGHCECFVAKQGGKQVSRASRLRRGYQRISSHPVA